MFGLFNKKKPEPKTVQQRSVGGKVVGRFVALKNFKSKTFETAYVNGQIYNLRDGNKRLLKKVNEWVSAGKVKII